MGWIWIAFFFSGVAGLSYELTWLRYLIHLFGASTPAVSATVAVFFTGLALGSFLGGRIFDRLERPILAYAGLELSIGLVSSLVPLAFSAVDGWLTQSMVGDSIGLGPLLLGSLGLLIVPTTLLGATFPAMAAVVKSLNNPTGSTGLFYGFNTLGAVFGCLVVSFWALPAFGPRSTTWLLATLNVLIAATVFSTHRKLAAGTGASSSSPATASEGGFPLPLAMFLAGCSGFVGILVEVVWVRGLALSFPASIYAFALVLSAYLVGIGLGSLAIGSHFQKRGARPRHLAVLYLVCGGGVWLTLLLFPLVRPASLSMIIDGWVGGWGSYVGILAVLSVGAMLPATLAMGAALPMLVGLSTHGRSDVGRVAGGLYGVNTLAGVFGSLAGTFVLMPWLGAARVLGFMTSAFLVMGLIVLVKVGSRRGLMGLVGVFAAAVFLLSLADLQPDINPQRQRHGQELLFYKDDASATVTVHETKKDGTRELRLNNQYGLSRTSTSTVAMQYTFGHLPMLMHEDPEEVLLIGFATGTTLAAMTEHGAKKVDCVEIHGLTIDLAPYFKDVNQAVYDKREVRTVAADGRRYLAGPGPSYDVIVGDLYLPRNPGVGALFSYEHFSSARGRLNPGGVFVAWLPLFQMGPEELASATRSFLEVFPDAQGYVGNWNGSSPVIGLAGRAPGGKLADAKDLDLRLSAALKGSIERVVGGPVPPEIRSFVEVPVVDGNRAGRLLLSSAALEALSKGAPINNIENPFIEFSAPRSMMNAALSHEPISQKSIAFIGRVVSLQGTPWAQKAGPQP